MNENEVRKARKIIPGGATHLGLLGAPMGFNFLVGKDLEEVQAFGRAVWMASRRQTLAEVVDVVENNQDSEIAGFDVRAAVFSGSNFYKG